MRWALLLLALVACHREEPVAVATPKPARSLSLEDPRAISADEDLRVLRVPSSEAPNEPSLDHVCVLYRNRASGLARIACPGGQAEDHPYGED